MTRHSNELTVYGLKAVKAIADLRPDDIKRLFFTRDVSHLFSEACRSIAVRRGLYRMVEPDELEKITDSVHHGGAAAVISKPEIEAALRMHAMAWAEEARVVLALDRVGNAHNFGAMVRTAAFLGIRDVVIAGDEPNSLINGASYRIAEGGFEHVRLWHVGDLAGFVEITGPGKNVAKQGIISIAADHRAELTLQDLADAIHTVSNWKSFAIMPVLGNEEEGLSPKVRENCTFSARVEGSGLVESLNVAQAGAIFMHSLVSLGITGKNKEKTAKSSEKTTR